MNNPAQGHESDSKNLIFINNICKLNENDEIAYCADCYHNNGKLIPLTIVDQGSANESYECIVCKSKHLKV